MGYKPTEGDRVVADGYGDATVEQVAQFDSLVLLRLPGGDTAWTDASLIKPLDS